jgi:predicted ATPase
VLHTGRPELFLVSGYSGIGKSSVVHELHKPVVRRRGLFLSGKFDQFQRDIPYATLAQVIRGLVQQLLAGTDEELARWRERLNRAWEDQGQALVDLVPQLEVVVGKQPALQMLPPHEAQHRFHRVVRHFLGVFATAEQPLVVFLDDLQWADLSSLQLIQQQMSQAETLPVMWIGAYRDNEVTSAHPRVSVLEQARKAGARLTEIRLEPLSLEQVQQLVTDALPGVSAELVAPLSALVHEKTGGNPFFLLQWMMTLNQDGLLARTPGGGWRWDAEGVRARGYSDNVVDFMVGKLRQLPARTQELLRLAACVGNAFPLQLLGALSGQGEVEEVEQGLEPALQESLVVRAGPEQYRFLHDRIQQAAHVLTSETERKALHLRIGRLLLKSLSPEQLRERIFDVVISQLNVGMELIDDPVERHELARLNVQAGEKAEAAVAHLPGIAYFTAAFALIPGEPWETDYELAFKAQMGRARCEFQTGNIVGARARAEEVRSRARTRADTTAAYCLKSDSYMATGEFPAAISCSLECLAMLGIPMSREPTREELAAAHEEVMALLGERPIESLIDLPPMTDLDMKVVMGALSSLFPKAFATNHQLAITVLSRMVSLTLRHGFTDAAALGYAWFGVLTGTLFKRYREGYAWAVLGRAAVEKYNLSFYRTMVLLGLQGISSWTQPLSVVEEIALTGFQWSLQVGNFYYASFFAYGIVAFRIAMGHNLEDVYQESTSRMEFVVKSGAVEARDMLLPSQRYVQQLRGYSRSFATLSGEGFDEQAFEAGLTLERSAPLRAWYWIVKVQSRFLCGSYREALEAAKQTDELIWTMFLSIALREFLLYRALTRRDLPRARADGGRGAGAAGGTAGRGGTCLRGGHPRGAGEWGPPVRGVGQRAGGELLAHAAGSARRHCLRARGLGGVSAVGGPGQGPAPGGGMYSGPGESCARPTRSWSSGWRRAHAI